MMGLGGDLVFYMLLVFIQVVLGNIVFWCLLICFFVMYFFGSDRYIVQDVVNEKLEVGIMESLGLFYIEVEFYGI